jgi:hypothetical protein
MTAHTTQFTLTSVDDEVPATARFTLDKSLAVRELADHLTALSAGRRLGTLAVLTDNGTAARATGTVALSGVGGTAATGSYALSGVGGTAASNTVTLGGGAGDVTIVTDGTSVGPVVFNTDDTQTALDCITALNANGTFAAKATASDGGAGVITITWDTKGTVGNSKTLTASRTAGTATVGGNGTTLGGGAQGAVTVVINGTSVGPVDVTNLSDTAAATAVAAAIELNGTLAPLLVAVGSTTNVNLTWGAKGTAGNAVTLAAGTSATGTATRSAATLENGAQGSVTVTIGGTAVVTDTTNITDTAAATAVAAAITANSTVNKWVTAAGSTTNVNLTAILYGLIGNSISLTSSTATGTATAGAARLAGGTADTSTVTVTF